MANAAAMSTFYTNLACGPIQAGIPLNLLQRWLGHAQLTTTAIYANAVGPEERTIAARMWT
jgi:integrase/recombinase XerD